jgi:nucleoside-diphosphate-sugar epimerase
MSVMKAAHACQVKRVVITSSCVAIMYPNEAPEDGVYNESHWSDIDNPGASAYVQSKTLAEKAAWDFLESLPEDEKFEIATICPTYVTGPSMIGGDFGSG